MDRNKREKLKRQATAAAVATVASASVMVGGILPDDGVFDDGAEDFPTPIVETVPLRGAGGDAPEAGTVAGSEEEKKSCLGKFRNAEGNEATFTWENGDLHLTMGGKEREFIMAGHDLIILPGEFSQSDILLLREEGRGVWGVRTGGRILTRQ